MALENGSRGMDPADIRIGDRVEIVSTAETYRLIEQAALCRTENNEDRYPVKAALRANVQALEVDAFGAPLPDDTDRDDGAWIRRVRDAFGDGQRAFIERLANKLHSGIVLGRGFVVAVRKGHVILSEVSRALDPKPHYTDPRWIRVTDTLVRRLGESGTATPAPATLSLALVDGEPATGRWKGELCVGGETHQVGPAPLAALGAILGGAATPAESALKQEAPLAAETVSVSLTPSAAARISRLAGESGVIVMDGLAVVQRRDATVRLNLGNVPDGRYRIEGGGLVREGDAGAAAAESAVDSVTGGTECRLAMTARDLGSVAGVADPDAGEAFANLLLRASGDRLVEIVACGPSRIVRRLSPAGQSLDGEIQVGANEVRLLAELAPEEPVVIRSEGDLVTLIADGVSVTSYARRATVPQFEAYIPRRAKVVARMPRAALLQALDAIEPEVDPKRRTVEVVASQRGFQLVPWYGETRGTPVEIPGERLKDEVVPNGDLALIAPLDLSKYNPTSAMIGRFRLDYLREAALGAETDTVCLAGTAINRPFVLYPVVEV